MATSRIVRVPYPDPQAGRDPADVTRKARAAILGALIEPKTPAEAAERIYRAMRTVGGTGAYGDKSKRLSLRLAHEVLSDTVRCVVRERIPVALTAIQHLDGSPAGPQTLTHWREAMVVVLAPLARGVRVFPGVEQPHHVQNFYTRQVKPTLPVLHVALAVHDWLAGDVGRDVQRPDRLRDPCALVNSGAWIDAVVCGAEWYRLHWSSAALLPADGRRLLRATRFLRLVPDRPVDARVVVQGITVPLFDDVSRPTPKAASRSRP
ncbi:hypothetical protein [Azospirillum sp. sgz301742]